MGSTFHHIKRRRFCRSSDALLLSDNAILLGDKLRKDVNQSIYEIILRYVEEESKRQNRNRIRLPMSKSSGGSDRCAAYVAFEGATSHEIRWINRI